MHFAFLLIIEGERLAITNMVTSAGLMIPELFLIPAMADAPIHLQEVNVLIGICRAGGAA